MRRPGTQGERSPLVATTRSRYAARIEEAWRLLVCLATGLLCTPSVGRSQCAPTEIAEITSPYASEFDGFGTQLAISERFLAVVDHLDDQLQPNGGAVFVYRRLGVDPSRWVLDSEIRLAEWGPQELSGASLDVHGETLVLGVREDDSLGPAAGAAFVFERTAPPDPRWRLVSKLQASDAHQGAFFGQSVAIHGDCIVIGAPLARRSGIEVGAAYVFRRPGGDAQGWIQSQVLTSESLTALGQFGSTVAMGPDRVVVGSPFSDLIQPAGGAVFSFHRREGTWQFEDVLAPPELVVNDQFGSGLTLDGDVLAVGAPGDDSLAKNGGAVYVYSRTKSGWSEHIELDAIGVTGPSSLGFSLSMEQDVLTCGMPSLEFSGPGSGAVVQFRRHPEIGDWFQASLFSVADSKPFDFAGIVDAAGGVLAIGAAHADAPGAVHLFVGRDAPTATTYCKGTAGVLRDCVPALDVIGAPTSSMLSSFEISSASVPGAQFWLFLYTTAGSARPDLRASGVCLPSGITRRSGLFWSGGTAGACDGSLFVDWNELASSLAPEDPTLLEPGTTVYGQFVWFDLFAPSVLTWSDALAFQLCP